MEAIYVDLHIHTTDNANDMAAAANYDVAALVQKIKEFNGDNDFLISFTDHNTINEAAYLKAKALGLKLILGAELHIKNSEDRDAYHCHIFFNTTIDTNSISEINSILGNLYPDKLPQKDDPSIPDIQKIINSFAQYEIMLLPHAGQQHGQFHYSIDKGARLDNAINRSIYYNQFDGFTARANSGLELTHEYFSRLGISDFVNLLTCSDNYSPSRYPEPKAKDAAEFIPTWMFAQPTFDGVRLALSESTRLRYQKEKPNKWSQHITEVSLHNEHIDIDVKLTAGLNVVIGGSSSGKSLFVDSLNNKVYGNFENSVYNKYYGVEAIEVTNASGMHPYYIKQNYVMETLNNNEERSIDKIELIKKIFPGDGEITKQITSTLNLLNTDIRGLISCVEKIESLVSSINAIPHPGSLVIDGKVQQNIYSELQPSADDRRRYTYTKESYSTDCLSLEKLRQIIKNNPYVECPSDAFAKIQSVLIEMRNASELSCNVATLIGERKDAFDKILEEQHGLNQHRVRNKTQLLDLISEYVASVKQFYFYKHSLMTIHHAYQTQEIESMGHKLSIKFNFSFKKEDLLESLNNYLKFNFRTIDDVKPENLFSKYFKERPRVTSFDELSSKIYGDLSNRNNRSYDITSREGRKFEELSAGWKTSILLDLILGYDGDNAPIIIDQPEDNLAVKYINEDLVKSIKTVKTSKQIIIVSHNATIPMLADAQNIILCECNGKNIRINSAPLEGNINGIPVLDIIANKTDGGKASIKKRVKKYNIKNYR